MSDVKYLTKEQLKHYATPYGAHVPTRSISREMFDRLNPTYKYLVVQSFIHNDSEVRTEVMVDHDGRTVWVDLPIATFNALPSVDVAALSRG